MTPMAKSEPFDGARAGQARIPVSPLNSVQWKHFSETLGSEWRAAAALAGFDGKARQLLFLPDREGGLSRVLLGLGDKPDTQVFRDRGGRLPAGEYFLDQAPDSISPEAIAIAFSLG